MKKVAILQSNYIPWKGYFDMIAAVDEFILYDDMQYTRRDWRNRNKIKTPQGSNWITVPVKVKGRFDQKILDTEIDDAAPWIEDHWKAITLNYKKAPHFEEVFHLLNPIYQKGHTHLSDLNRDLITTVCGYLDISTKVSSSSEYTLADGKTSRLVDLCKQAGASEYISGPAAKDYVEEDLFAKADIELTWFDYSGYAPYPQKWGEFTHAVSIVDLLCNCGKESPQFMRYVNP